MLPHGCYVATVTPFKADGSIDEDGLRENVNFLLERGVAGIVPCGTTGESPTLAISEKAQVVRIVAEEVKGAVQIIAGAGTNDTPEAAIEAQMVMDAGADAILCITPYYNKPSQRGLIEHFTYVAKQTGAPMVLYNVPGRTAVNMLPETILALCDLPEVIAVKEASGNVAQASEIHRLCGDRITLFCGDDALTLPMLSIGARGVISVIGNILPHRMTALIDAWFDGNTREALSIHEEIIEICGGMFIETSPQPVKTLMNEMGMKGGFHRLPMTTMADENRDKLFAIARKAGLLS